MLKVVISGKERTVIRMSGKINEAADLHMVIVPAVESIEVDLIDVTHINSVGIRQFRDWIMGLKSNELLLSYCPRVFIDQVNMIVDFIPKHTRIKSFYVPYFNESSGEEKSILFSRGEHFQIVDGKVQIHWPQIVDSKGRPMEVDVLKEKYFHFLRSY